MTTFLYWFTASNGLLRKTCVTAVCLFFGAVVPGCGSASEAYVPQPPSQPIPMDGTTYEWIGRQALAQYGYEEIIKRGVDAGFLRYPDSEQTNTQNFVGQTMAEAARQAWPVFTKGAVMAFLTSQLDSPAPGPADVLAIGMLVVAIAEASSVAAMVLTSSTTATATAVPTATPVPTAKPTTTAPPIATPTTTTSSPPPTTKGNRWQCSASCNVQQINQKVVCPARVTGTAGGPNEPAACVEAKRSATQSTPAGCYPRHCQCRCSRK